MMDPTTHGSPLACLRLQASHSPLDVPEESLFTNEQLENLKLVASEAPLRVRFAKIIYFLDITVRDHCSRALGFGLMLVFKSSGRSVNVRLKLTNHTCTY